MRRNVLARLIGLTALAAIVVSTPSLTSAARPDKGPIKAKPEGEVIEMFAGIKSGDIEVKFIAKDPHEATVLFRNKTDRPLAIQLPEAFAGVPVLAQVGQNPFGQNFGQLGQNLGNQGQGQNNATQGLGGGFGQNGGLNGGLNQGFFNVGPDKVRKLKVNTVCLEHGKPDPNPHVAYEIRPIESFTKDEAVIELCKLIGRGEVSTNAAQAAAWHLANGMSFEQLAKGNRIVRHNGSAEKLFSQKDLQTASQVVKHVRKGHEAPAEKTLARSTSQSQK